MQDSPSAEPGTQSSPESSGWMSDADFETLSDLRKHALHDTDDLEEEPGESHCRCTLSSLAELSPDAGAWVKALLRQKNRRNVLEDDSSDDGSSMITGSHRSAGGPSAAGGPSQRLGYRDMRKFRTEQFQEKRVAALNEQEQMKERVLRKHDEQTQQQNRRQQEKQLEYQQRSFNAQQKWNEQKKVWRELQADQERAWADYYMVPYSIEGESSAAASSSPKAPPPASSNSKASNQALGANARWDPVPVEAGILDPETHKEAWKIYRDVLRSHNTYSGEIDRWKQVVLENERRMEAHWQKLFPEESPFGANDYSSLHKRRKFTKAVRRLCHAFGPLQHARSSLSLPCLHEEPEPFVTALPQSPSRRSHDPTIQLVRQRHDHNTQMERETNLRKWHEKEVAISDSRERRHQILEERAAVAQKAVQEWGRRQETALRKAARGREAALRASASSSSLEMQRSKSCPGIGALSRSWDGTRDVQAAKEELHQKLESERARKLAAKDERHAQLVRDRHEEQANKVRATGHNGRMAGAAERRDQLSKEFSSKVGREIEAKQLRSKAVLGQKHPSMPELERYRSERATTQKGPRDCHSHGVSDSGAVSPSGSDDSQDDLGIEVDDPDKCPGPVKVGGCSGPVSPSANGRMKVVAVELGTQDKIPRSHLGNDERPIRLPILSSKSVEKVAELDASYGHHGDEEIDEEEDQFFHRELAERSGKWMKDMKRKDGRAAADL